MRPSRRPYSHRHISLGPGSFGSERRNRASRRDNNRHTQVNQFGCISEELLEVAAGPMKFDRNDLARVMCVSVSNHPFAASIDRQTVEGTGAGPRAVSSVSGTRILAAPIAVLDCDGERGAVSWRE